MSFAHAPWMAPGSAALAPAPMGPYATLPQSGPMASSPFATGGPPPGSASYMYAPGGVTMPPPQSGHGPPGGSAYGQPPSPRSFGPPMTMPPMGGPAFQSTSALPPPGSASGLPGGLPRLGQNLALVVSRLLDMPIEENLFGTKRYRIRVYDDRARELGASKPIEGLTSQQARHRDMETLSVPRDRGIIRLSAESQLLHVEVEHVGGLLGGALIGRCQIHRLDPRSSQIWPYALSDLDALPAHCGIELKVVEEGGPPIPVDLSPMPSAAQLSPRPTMGLPMSGPLLGLSTTPPGSMSQLGGRQYMQAAMQDMNHGVSAVLEFEKVADLPYPRSDQLREVVLAVLSDETQKELRRIGPFAAMDQGASARLGRLVRADCGGACAFVQAPLHFGGAAEEGAMYLRVAASYADAIGEPAGLPEIVGVTDAIKVSWVPAPTQYHELRARDGKTLGGVYFKHRLLTEAEAAAQHHATAVGAAGKAKGKRVARIGAPVEPLHRVSGRTGSFPPGSQEEAFEQAAINAEAQNRALLQRCKIADPSTDESNPHVRVVNGYREWDDLDSLFSTLGPNPLAMSEEVGPTVTRSYQERSTVLKELEGQLPAPRTPADAALNLELIGTMYNRDPRAVVAALRPVVCKSPGEIAGTKDMSWCPDPPIYAPLRNMGDEDRETLRLACYAPETSAKLLFCDANPNYRVTEDIWSVLADYKTAQSLVVPKLAPRRRVKDDCIMA